MRRHLPALFWILPLLAISGPVSAAITYYRITAGASTANSENACPAWVPETNHDDCSYNASDPSGLGTDQWIGPVFSAGYYAPDAAPPVFTNTLPPPPIIAPAPELPLGGKTGIPIARGFVAINDNDTSEDPADDVIFGTIEFGVESGEGFERNVATGPASRVVESFGRIIHRIIPVPPSGPIDGTRNAGGGFDYVVGISGALPVFPSNLDDAFPNEVASQSSVDPADIPFWTAPVPNGISRLEGVTRTTGTTTTASVWDYSCDAGTGPGTCEISAQNEINWNSGTRARFDNVLLRISTNDSGDITDGAAFLVNESNLSAEIPGNDSWQATTLSFTGTSASLPDAFDDRAFLTEVTEGVATIDSAVLDNDATGAAPVTIAPPPPLLHGSAAPFTTLSGTTVIRYTKNSSDPYLGDVDIPYTISDGNGDTADAKLVVTITDPVTCTDDSLSIAQNAVTPIDEFLVNDTGLDVPPVTVSITTPPAFGTAALNPDNTITYTPPENSGGLFTFRYRASEGAVTASANPQCTVSVRVAGQPRAVNDTVPEPGSLSPGIEDHTATTIDVLANDPASANSPVTIRITSRPTNGTLYILPGSSSNNPIIRYSSILGYEGPDSFRYRVIDADGEPSNVATVYITVMDSQPVLVNSGVNVEDQVQTAITPLGGNTTLVDSPVTLTITVAPTHGTAVVVPASGNNPPFINYTPETGYLGADSLSYRVTDTNGDFGEATIAITVTDSIPVARDDPIPPIPPASPRNGDARGAVRMVVMSNDTELADRPITIEITQQGTLGSASLVAASATGNGLPDIAYASNPDSAGTDTVKYRLRDADGDVSATAATVTIDVANGTPVAVDDDPRTLEDGKALSINVLANDMGRNNRPLTIAITQPPTDGTVVVNPGSATSDPTVTYTPASGFVGADSFRYRFTDGDQQTSATAALVPLSVMDSMPALDDLERTGDARELTLFDVYAGATGLVDTPLTLEIIQQPANGTANVVTGGARPEIEYASDRDFAGTDTVRYRVTDSDGDFSEATLTLNVANPTTPVAMDDTGGDSGLFSTGNNVVIERMRTQIDVLHNDEGVSNTPITVQITDEPDHGTAEIELPEVTGFDGPVIAYQGEAGYSGPDSFKYTVTDDDGETSNEAATVSFTVVCFPIATADGLPTPIRTNLNAAKNVRVLDNDGGLCAGPIVVTIESTVNGTAVVNPNRTITFTPTAGFTGQWPAGCDPSVCFPFGGGFTYRITDVHNETSVESVTIDVLPPPVTDDGGSTMDLELLALLLFGGLLRGRRQGQVRAAVNC